MHPGGERHAANPGTALGEASLPVTFPGPAATIEGAFDLLDMVFPAAGSYSLSLYAGDRFLVERRLEVGPGP